jgi:hypothetical protein
VTRSVDNAATNVTAVPAEAVLPSVGEVIVAVGLPVDAAARP